MKICNAYWHILDITETHTQLQEKYIDEEKQANLANSYVNGVCHDFWIENANESCLIGRTNSGVGFWSECQAFAINAFQLVLCSTTKQDIIHTQL